jgi:RHS repeat-associated protein
MAMSVNYLAVDSEVLAHTKATAKRDYLPDMPGNTAALLDNTQARVEEFKYWPFGEERVTAAKTTERYRYSGIYGCATDVVNDRISMRARIQRPKQGRLIAVDPLWPFYDGYGYAGNSPCEKADPSGLLQVVGHVEAGNWSWLQSKCTALDQATLKKILASPCAALINKLCGADLLTMLKKASYQIADHCDKALGCTTLKYDASGRCSPGSICLTHNLCTGKGGLTNPRTGKPYPWSAWVVLLGELGNFCQCRSTHKPPLDENYLHQIVGCLLSPGGLPR